MLLYIIWGGIVYITLEDMEDFACKLGKGMVKILMPKN